MFYCSIKARVRNIQQQKLKLKLNTNKLVGEIAEKYALKVKSTRF